MAFWTQQNQASPDKNISILPPKEYQKTNKDETLTENLYVKKLVTGQIKLAQAFSIFNGLYQDIHLGQKYGTLLTQKYLNKVHQISLYLLSLRYAISSSYMNGSSKIFCTSYSLKFRVFLCTVFVPVMNHIGA